MKQEHLDYAYASKWHERMTPGTIIWLCISFISGISMFDLHYGEHSQTISRHNLEVNLHPLLIGGLHDCSGGQESTKFY